METIVTNPETVSRKTIVRVNRAHVSTPSDGDPEFFFGSEEKLYLNGEPTAVIKNETTVRKLKKVADERVVVTDPMTKLPVSMSAACLVEALTAFHARWFRQDHPG